VSKDLFGNHRLNTGIILVLIILFVSVIYLPKTIWDQEAALTDQAHFQMETVGLAEKLHYQLVKAYTTDTEQLVSIVNGVRDSLLAAAQDTNYNYYGHQDIALPAKEITVNYSPEYQQAYQEMHLKLFKLLQPHHFMDGLAVQTLLDSIEALFQAGNYTGDQTMVLDTVSLSFNVSDKYDILYQNIKTSMFNALTNSYTKYPDFSNPLVDAVMDSIEANPELSGKIDFAALYDGPVRVDFIIPNKFAENLEKTKLSFKKQFILDPYDSVTFGDTLYDMALTDFMLQMDTTTVIPDMLNLIYADTSGEHEIPVEVDVDNMATAMRTRRNRLYKMLTGYNEPSEFIAERVIAVALDSLKSPNAGLDSIHLDIDLTNAVFTISVRRNIMDYFQKVSLDHAYYHTGTNLTDLDWDRAAVDVVESVAESLKRHSDFKKWQIVEVPADTFYVNVFDEFLRKYDDMNIDLYKQLTGDFTNIHDYAYNVVSRAEELASVDSLNWKGTQVMTFGPDTIHVDVFPKYLEEYENTFTIARDTVVQADDSTFKGVWSRGLVDVVADPGADTLAFIGTGNISEPSYDYHGADSVRAINILEKADTLRVEEVYYGLNTYILLFTEDSLMRKLYRIADEYSTIDSADLDSLHVVSDEFVVGIQEKDLFMSKDSFGGWQDTLIHKKFMKKQLFAHYLLSPELVRCPVTDLPFRITVRNNVNLRIESPIKTPIMTRRYLFFTEQDSSAGSIQDGEESWSK